MALAASLVVLSACATLNARKHISAGQKAETAGDLDGAARSYKAAADAAPKNASYKERYRAARKVAVKAHAKKARAAEKKRKYKKALAHWRDAIALHPKSATLKARAELAELRTRRSEPIEFYRATKRLANALPKDRGTQKALRRARADAVKYYVRLAETYADAGAVAQAYTAYEKAHAVHPEHEVFRGSMYRVTKAKHYEVLGDAKMKAGDRLAAFKAYEEALTAANLPQLRRKMQNAKRAAGGVLEQIGQARGFEAAEQWEDAAEMYTLLLDRDDAPGDIAEAAKRTRAKSARIRAERAQAFAERDVVEQAQASLTMALEHVDGHVDVVALLQTGLGALQSGDPSTAKVSFDDAAAINGKLIFVKAAKAVLGSSARVMFAEAQALAQRDPAGAMVRIEKLAAFKKSLPGYKKAKKQLVKKAFVALLDKAEAKAAIGDDAQAAELLSTALEVARAPKKIRAPLLAGCHALRTRDYATAEAVFSKVLAKDGRSRIARTGQRIARKRNLASLRQQAEEAMAVDDSIRAAAAFRQILQIEPDDAAAKTGLEDLRASLIDASVAAASAHLESGRPGAAYVYFKRVLDLEPAHPGANEGITKATGKFEAGNAPLAWVAPVDRVRGLPHACSEAHEDLRGRLILYLTRTRNLGTEFLHSGQTAAVDNEEREQPTIALRTVIEKCELRADGGSMSAVVQIAIGPEVLFGQKVKGVFDPTSVPKDELEDGIDQERVLDGILNGTARAAAAVVRVNAEKLRAWRAIEARARISAGDEEGAARAYAKLRMDEDRLTPAERSALADLERFILNRFR